MTDCPTCGAPLDADASFCSRCGGRVPSGSDDSLMPAGPGDHRAVCPECGAPLAATDRFCTRCGARRQMGTEAAASDSGQTSPPPPASPQDTSTPSSPSGTSRTKARPRTLIIAALALVVAAGIGAAVYFGFFYGTSDEDDVVAALGPVLAPVASAQKDANAALEALTASGPSFEQAAAAGTALREAVAKAQRRAGGR